jgi:predicted dehydrogenase
MTRLRVGLFGCGGIGVRHAQSVNALADEMELVACCGRDMDRTQQFAAQHGGWAYVDLENMLQEAALDLMIVAHPPYMRAGEVERIAARGVHLLVEKPIALTQAAADAMVSAVEATGVTAAVGFMYRHGAALQAWQAASPGKVGMMTAAFQCNHLHAPWWREEAKSGGQIVEQLLHLIDLVRFCMGEPDTVVARRARLFYAEPGYDIEDVSAMIFGWDDGRIATLNANNIAVHGQWYKEWSLFAQQLTGRFRDWNTAEFTRSDGSGMLAPITSTASPFEAQLRDVAEAIRTKRPPRVPLVEGARTLRLALAARQAADEKRELRLT